MGNKSAAELQLLEKHRKPGGLFGNRPYSEETGLSLAGPAGMHRQLAKSVILSSTPEERAYYAANDAKHFGPTSGPGSQFVGIENTAALVALASEQRGSLDGDDRETLLALGGDPGGFMEGMRYLMVKADGVLGIKSGAEVDDSTPITVTRTKPGAPCSLVAAVRGKTAVDYGVVIMGTHDVTGQPFVITTFPGQVTRPTADPRVDELEDRTLPAGMLRELLGQAAFDTMTLNTRLVA